MFWIFLLQHIFGKYLFLQQISDDGKIAEMRANALTLDSHLVLCLDIYARSQGVSLDSRSQERNHLKVCLGLHLVLSSGVNLHSQKERGPCFVLCGVGNMLPIETEQHVYSMPCYPEDGTGTH